MRLWAAGVGLAGLLAGLYSPPDDRATLIVGGDTLGYLSPCGCTKPMSGGLRRRVAAIRSLGSEGTAVVVENGGLVSGTGRQDELKAETLAEALADAGVAAVHVTSRDAALGPAMLGSLQRLSKGTLLSSSLEPVEGFEASESVTKGPFLIGALDPDAARSARLLDTTARPFDAQAEALLAQAAELGKAAVLLYAGGLEEARTLARRHPGFRAVVYRSTATPPDQAEREGGTWLLSAGEKGKAVVAASWRNGGFVGYRVVPLGPEITDDPATARLYRAYLDRVGEEGLLKEMPRPNQGEYVGSEACFGCHAAEAAVWSGTKHASALRTLEKEGHDRDPDCVGCHVVALDAPTGFRSRRETPTMTDVGCESCHGPGKAHVARPLEARMPKVGANPCRSCHVPDHSPGFDFDAYWARIKHGSGENLGIHREGSTSIPR